MFDLSGRVALETGAGQGIGVGIARALSARSAAVAVNDLYEDRARTTAESILQAGGKALALAFDEASWLTGQTLGLNGGTTTS